MLVTLYLVGACQAASSDRDRRRASHGVGWTICRSSSPTPQSTCMHTEIAVSIAAWDVLQTDTTPGGHAALTGRAPDADGGPHRIHLEHPLASSSAHDFGARRRSHCIRRCMFRRAPHRPASQPDAALRLTSPTTRTSHRMRAPQLSMLSCWP